MSLPIEFELAIERFIEKLASREHLADSKWRQNRNVRRTDERQRGTREAARRAYHRTFYQTGDHKAAREAYRKERANAA